jgi:hypothetical protein
MKKGQIYEIDENLKNEIKVPMKYINWNETKIKEIIKVKTKEYEVKINIF